MNTDARDPVEFNRTEKAVIRPDGSDFTMQRPIADEATTPAAAVETAPEPKPMTDLDAGPEGFKSRKKRERTSDIAKQAMSYKCHAKAIYPPKSRSRLLCLKNLALPFRNRPFTYLVGLIYFVFAWAFTAADPRQSPIAEKQSAAIIAEIQRADAEVGNHKAEAERLRTMAAELVEQAKAQGSDPKDVQTYAAEIARAEETLVRETAALAAAKLREAELQPSLHRDLSAIAFDPRLGVGEQFHKLASTSLAFLLDGKALLTAAEQSPMFAFMLIGLWAALVHYVESRSTLVKLLIGTLHATAHVVVLLIVSWFAQASGLMAGMLGLTVLGNSVSPELYSTIMPHLMSEGALAPDVFRIVWSVVVTLLVGGLLGGLVMGLYWTLTSTLLNMHTGDAFGALGISNYKHFLRIKLEPDRATIYPIALDKVPGRNGWRWKLNKGEKRPDHRPLILPNQPLRPRLIEKPIEIDVAAIAD